DHRDLVVGVESQKSGAVLIALFDIHGMDVVRQARLLEHDRSLVAVGRLVGVKLDRRHVGSCRLARPGSGPLRDTYVPPEQKARWDYPSGACETASGRVV